MAKESYEYEPIERIQECLNCDYPDYLCHGKGNCKYRRSLQGNKKRKPGELEHAVLELYQSGMKLCVIAYQLNARDSTIRNTISRLRNKGVIK